MADKKPNNRVVTPYGRVSYPNLDEPREYEEGDAKFQITLLFPKENQIDKLSPWDDYAKHDLSTMRQIAKIMTAEAYPNGLPKKFKMPFLDGDDAEWDGYEGNWYIRFNSKKRPGAVSVSQKAIDLVDVSNTFYPGSWARVIANPYCYDKKQKGFNFGLRHVQFICDGEPFGDDPDPVKAFENFDKIPEGDVAPADLGDLE